MNGDDFARLAYLIILGSAIAGWLFVESRGRLGQAARQALAWALIFLGVAAGYGLWQDMQARSIGSNAIATSDTQVVVPRGRGGHFYLTLTVQGEPIRFMVDTGATAIVLSDADTARLGIDKSQLAFLGRARTANGEIRTALVTLRDVRLGDVAEGDLIASVGDGPLDISLLGMDYLRRFSRVEMTPDTLVLTR
jgi:aspartyl protease family protein